VVHKKNRYARIRTKTKIKVREKMHNSFYFLHIPKTAGRFFTHNIVAPLRDPLIKNGIHSFYDREKYVAHQHWGNFIDKNTYVTSLIRDPIKHAVSSYCHYTMLDVTAQRTVPLGLEEFNKYDMFKWWEYHLDFISNQQSKNFLIEDPGIREDGSKIGYGESQIMKNCIVTKEIILKKLEDVSLLIKSENLSLQNVSNIHKKILGDFNIHNVEIKHKIQKASNYWNPDSTRIYNSLNEKDKEKIFSYSPIDAEIYNTSSLFYDFKKENNE
jgi:hypothetical protein